MAFFKSKNVIINVKQIHHMYTHKKAGYGKGSCEERSAVLNPRNNIKKSSKKSILNRHNYCFQVLHR